MTDDQRERARKAANQAAWDAVPHGDFSGSEDARIAEAVAAAIAAYERVMAASLFTEDERKAMLIVLYGQEPPGRSPCYHWETVQRHDRLVACARAKLERMG